MHNPPTFTYQGLTIIMSQPSRMDLMGAELMAGTAGTYVNEECLYPHFNRYQCDIRTSDMVNLPFLPDTKCLLLLGEKAMHEWTIGYNEYKLQEQRGLPLNNRFNIPAIASFLPQDAMDVVDHESRHNYLLQGSESDEDRLKKAVDEKRHHGVTTRGNYRFWLRRDINKCKSILTNNGRIPQLYEQQPTYNIYPSSEEVITRLLSTKNRELYLDIETDAQFNIRCIGFLVDECMVYVVPIIRYDYTLAYGERTTAILAAFAIAMCSNAVVCHNGWAFDLFVMAHFYRIPYGRRHYDTLLAQHRCFIEPEKSLGHCISYWLWEAFHKDEGMFNPHNREQEMQLYRYNAKDVFTMFLIKREQLRYARAHIGMLDSIQQANDMPYTYSLNTLFGIRYNKEQLLAKVKDNERRLTKLFEIISILTGGIDVLPTSSPSCINYFHKMKGYPVVARSKKTGNPSLDEKALLRLKLKYPEDAMITVCIEFRRLVKENGSLGFLPWKDPIPNDNPDNKYTRTDSTRYSDFNSDLPAMAC